MSWQLFYPFFSLENTALPERCRERLPMVYGTMAPTATFWKGWTMTRILFVCHGNICRSTMAQYVMDWMVERAGRAGQVECDSAATSTEELGNPVDPRTRRRLEQAGIPCGEHHSRQMTRADYGRFDLIVGMDSLNMRNMMRILGSDPDDKVHLLLDWSDAPRDISDPWYTGDFERTYQDVTEGCEALLAAL